MTKQLTAAFVKAAPHGVFGDQFGLRLIVKKSGSRQWVWRGYVHGVRRDLGLGGYPLVTLSEARNAAFECKKLARSGGDPMAAKREAKIPDFASAFESVLAIHRSSWKGDDSEKQWRASMRDYVLPYLGRMRVDQITGGDVLAVLLPHWHTKSETMRRVRQRIGVVMGWAIAQGYRGDNPAGDALNAALPRNGNGHRRHLAAAPYGDVAAILTKVRASDAGLATKLALEFLILTAARSGEVRGATWAEIDFESATWTVPASRMKANREHRVPLSSQALEILHEAKSLATNSGLVFPSPRGKVLTDNTLSKMLRDLEVGSTVHGLRSSFRDWAAETTDYPREVCESALAHTNKNEVESAYLRTDYLSKRAELMQKWADTVGS